MAGMSVDLMEQTSTGVTVRVEAPPPEGFASTIVRFFRELDQESLMGGALGRSPESMVEGILAELMDLAELWEAEF
jgi:hypothetical protein